jgi:hypothetical protein
LFVCFYTTNDLSVGASGGVAPGRESLDVYQQLLAKMRERANKDGITMLLFCRDPNKSDRSSPLCKGSNATPSAAPIDEHPLQPGKDRLLQLRPLAAKT